MNNFMLLSLPAELVVEVGLRHIPGLCTICGISSKLRIGILRELAGRRGTISIRREDVTAGVAELISRCAQLEWIVVEDDTYISGWVTRVSVADITRGYLTSDDPVIAIIAAPIFRRRCKTGHLKFAGSPSFNFDLRKSIYEEQLCCQKQLVELTDIRLVPPEIREAAYIVLAGVAGPPADKSHSWPAAKLMRICLTGCSRTCGCALATAEKRRGEQFFSVEDDCVSRNVYSRPMQHDVLHPTPAAARAINACRRHHAIPLLGSPTRKAVQVPLRWHAAPGAPLLRCHFVVRGFLATLLVAVMASQWPASTSSTLSLIPPTATHKH